MINSALIWFWDRVARAAYVPAASLVAFRWILGCYLLLFDARYFAWVDRSPDAFFDPPLISISYLVGGFPPAPFFLVLDVLGIIAICLMTVGYRTRASTVVVLLTLLVSSSFAYSHGKISHQIALSAVLLCMIIANWGEGTDDRGLADGVTAQPEQRSRRVSQGMALLAVILAFGFLTAGFGKVLHWVNTDVTASGVLSWYYQRALGLDLELMSGLLPGLPPVFLKIADWSAAFLEVSGFIALLTGPIAWRVWLLLVTTMHLANALVLNITFTTQAVIYLAFVTLTGLLTLRLRNLRIAAMIAVALVGLWHIWTRIDGRGSGFFLWDDARSTFTYDLYVAIVICLIVMGFIANDIRKMLVVRQTSVDESAQLASVK